MSYCTRAVLSLVKGIRNLHQSSLLMAIARMRLARKSVKGRRAAFYVHALDAKPEEAFEERSQGIFILASLLSSFPPLRVGPQGCQEVLLCRFGQTNGVTPRSPEDNRIPFDSVEHHLFEGREHPWIHALQVDHNQQDQRLHEHFGPSIVPEQHPKRPGLEDSAACADDHVATYLRLLVSEPHEGHFFGRYHEHLGGLHDVGLCDVTPQCPEHFGLVFFKATRSQDDQVKVTAWCSHSHQGGTKGSQFHAGWDACPFDPSSGAPFHHPFLDGRFVQAHVSDGQLRMQGQCTVPGCPGVDHLLDRLLALLPPPLHVHRVGHVHRHLPQLPVRDGHVRTRSCLVPFLPVATSARAFRLGERHSRGSLPTRRDGRNPRGRGSHGNGKAWSFPSISIPEGIRFPDGKGGSDPILLPHHHSGDEGANTWMEVSM
eukprot:scaffold566_cov364-Pavlova_lutheri.AAC.14